MRKVISLILSAVMVMSAFFCVDLSAFATEINVSNRAEWLAKLADVFDMSVEDNNYPNNYFSDLDESSPYYYNVLLAAEFGLIDVEAGGEVNPEGNITREFAAHTLNFCLGFKLDSEDGEAYEYSFSDSADCKYPDDDQVAINREWFALDSGKFSPDKVVGANEINYMISDAQSVLSGDEIDENHNNVVEFSNDVIVIDESEEVDFNSGEVVIHSTAYNIEEGDTIAVYSYGLPIVYTALSVEISDGLTTVAVSEEVDENAVEIIDVQKIIDVDVKDIIPAEGYSVETKRSAAYAKGSGATIANNTVKLYREVTLPSGDEITIQATISNLQLQLSESSQRQSITAKAIFDIDLGVSIDVESGNLLSSIPSYMLIFGRIPVAGVGYIELQPILEISGTAELNQSFHVVAGFTSDNSGVHNISSFNRGRFYAIYELDGRLGIRVEAGITFICSRIDIFVEAGAAAKASVNVGQNANGDSLECLTLSVYLFLDIGAEVRIGIKPLHRNFELRWQVFTDENSPLRLYYHYENGIRVSECTAGEYVPPADPDHGGAPEQTWYSNDYELVFQRFDKEIDEMTVPDYAKVIGYQGTPVNVIVPSYYNGYKVTDIGSTFRNCISLKSITVPSSVKKMSWAFEGCTSLESVNIPNSATILYGTFSGCTSLKNITVPNSVEDMDYAFDGCTSLKSITVPSSVRYMDRAFQGCSSLESVNIPNGVTSIEGAFCGCTSLKSITVPSSVENMWCAFEGCTSLESVNIPNGVTSIEFAFRDCTSLKSITVPSSVENMWYAFEGCTSLESVNIPNGATIIGAAFRDCTSLKSITVPSGVDNMSCVFQGCTSLESVNIPNSATIIYGTFSGCTSLKNITVPSSVEDMTFAFDGCTSLKSITVPSSVRYMDWAFQGCTSLESVNIPNSATILWGAFFGCTSLESVSIPYGVKDITDAFCGCTSLKSITVPNSVEDMFNAFADCTSLKSANIPNNVTSSYGAYTNCYSLTDINISSGLEKIDDWAFENCTSLTDVHYSGSYTQWKSISIGENNDCLLSAKIHFNSTIPSDFSTLDAAIDSALNYPTSEFTSESLESLYETANSFAELAQSNPSQEECDAAVSEILSAIEHLDSLSNYRAKAIDGTQTTLINDNGNETTVSFEDNINGYCEPLDVNGDGIINAKDFAWLIKNYS